MVSQCQVPLCGTLHWQPALPTVQLHGRTKALPSIRATRSPLCRHQVLLGWRTPNKLLPRTKPASGNWADCGEREGQGRKDEYDSPASGALKPSTLSRAPFFSYLNLALYSPEGLILFPLLAKCFRLLPSCGQGLPFSYWASSSPSPQCPKQGQTQHRCSVPHEFS